MHLNKSLCLDHIHISFSLHINRWKRTSYTTFPVLFQDPADNTLTPFDFSNFTLDSSVSAVLCGLDTSINYTKLSKAFQYLSCNPGCLFLATHEDSTYPAKSGSAGGLLPGAGAVSAPLRYALGKDPLSIGKPAKTMLDCIQAKWVSQPLSSYVLDLVLSSFLGADNSSIKSSYFYICVCFMHHKAAARLQKRLHVA